MNCIWKKAFLKMYQNVQLLSTLVKDSKIKQIYGVTTGHARAAPEGTWTQGGGIELPCKYKIYRRENCKDMVQNLLKE